MFNGGNRKCGSGAPFSSQVTSYSAINHILQCLVDKYCNKRDPGLKHERSRMRRLCYRGSVPWPSAHPFVGGSDVIVRLLLQRAQCACVVLLLDVELLSEGVVHRLDLVDGDPAHRR